MRLRLQFGDEALSRTQVYDWIKSFEDGWTEVETCKDYTLCRESYGKHFLGLSGNLIH